MGEHFNFPLNLDESVENDEGERFESLAQFPDLYSEPEDLVLRSMRYDEIVDGIEKLCYLDSELLLNYWGIDCLYCGRVRQPTPLAGIADKYQLP